MVKSFLSFKNTRILFQGSKHNMKMWLIEKKFQSSHLVVAHNMEGNWLKINMVEMKTINNLKIW